MVRPTSSTLPLVWNKRHKTRTTCSSDELAGWLPVVSDSVTQRARILDILLNVLDKPHSFGDSKDGTWKMPPQTSMILAGINVTPEGFTIADAQLDVLR